MKLSLCDDASRNFLASQSCELGKWKISNYLKFTTTQLLRSYFSILGSGSSFCDGNEASQTEIEVEPMLNWLILSRSQWSSQKRGSRNSLCFSWNSFLCNGINLIDYRRIFRSWFFYRALCLAHIFIVYQIRTRSMIFWDFFVRRFTAFFGNVHKM